MKIAMRNWNAAVECKSALVYNLQKKKDTGNESVHRIFLTTNTVTSATTLSTDKL